MKFDIKDYEIILQVLAREKERIEVCDNLEFETETPEQIGEAMSAVRIIGTY